MIWSSNGCLHIGQTQNYWMSTWLGVHVAGCPHGWILGTSDLSLKALGIPGELLVFSPCRKVKEAGI